MAHQSYLYGRKIVLQKEHDDENRPQSQKAMLIHGDFEAKGQTGKGSIIHNAGSDSFSGLFTDEDGTIRIEGKVLDRLSGDHLAMKLSDLKGEVVATLEFAPIESSPYQFQVTGEVDLGKLIGDPDSQKVPVDTRARLGVYSDGTNYWEQLSADGQVVETPKTPVADWQRWLKPAASAATENDRDAASLEEVIDAIRRNGSP